MFRFNDEFTENKQKEKTFILLEKLLAQFTLYHSLEIEKFFDDNVSSYEFLEELPSLVRAQDHNIIMPCISYISSIENAQNELQHIYESNNKIIRNDQIPFIEFSFPIDYKCPFGDSYKHVYIFFYTDFKNFDESHNFILYYLNKLNKLKVFL